MVSQLSRMMAVIALVTLGLVMGARVAVGARAPRGAPAPLEAPATGLRSGGAFEGSVWVPAGSTASRPALSARPVAWTPAGSSAAALVTTLQARAWRPQRPAQTGR